ncbi:MAG: acetyl-CoA carboxylase biotin carboxyl carrier protein subunit [Prevotellaceae bacterium]|nr:acetyl-CoA carboxylase biotin carboxyl carrier protein subunit [Prevotellaceae bacterium]
MDIQVGNKIVDVTLLSKDGNNVKIDIDGQVYDVDVAMLQNGTCSIIHNGNSYKAELVKSDAGKHYRVNVNYSTYQIDMLDSQAKYMRMRKKTDAVQSDQVTAPMPCKIVKAYCKQGDKLKAGDTVLTMEAMKMQSNYKVAADCEVLSVLVAEGDSVKVGQTLITLKLNENNE